HLRVIRVAPAPELAAARESMMTNLEGRVYAVTGGSSGIGAALGPALVAAGAKVVLGARRTDRVTEITRPLGDQAHAVQMDVRRPEDGERLVQEALDTFGKIDGLIANAGIGMYGGILDNTDDELAEMLDTNVAGTVWPIRAVVPICANAARATSSSSVRWRACAGPGTKPSMRPRSMPRSGWPAVWTGNCTGRTSG